ncbi:hypothetical protein [Streptomyces tailanensis]|uniref:hypothetical protein n=1 Tax=Streptomyces tailanensis TaxID=2569858 RepID=UPI00122DE4A0|nr:hypothetical protein [Streptomyces tailanensis]
MSLRFIAKDPNTDGANCPPVWIDEEKQEIVMQGWTVDEATRAECLKTGSIPGSEAVVRLPMRMVAAIREACDAADGATVQ